MEIFKYREVGHLGDCVHCGNPGIAQIQITEPNESKFMVCKGCWFEFQEEFHYNMIHLGNAPRPYCIVDEETDEDVVICLPPGVTVSTTY